MLLSRIEQDTILARWVALAATVNHLWYARNLIIHEDRPFIVKDLIHNIQEDVYCVLYLLLP